MEADYTKRELDAHFAQVTDQLDRVERQNDEQIKQQKIANGRTSKLEQWQKGLAMSGAVITFLVLPLIIYSYELRLKNLKAEILATIISVAAADKIESITQPQ